MRKFPLLAGCMLMGATLFGCVSTGQVNLKQVAQTNGLTNITTGDGTFADYQAVSHSKATEIGFAVGLPGFCKFFEVFPANSNEDLLGMVAQDAKSNGATAIINASPANESYWGFPFIIAGLYIDHSEGTGITVK